MVNVSVNAASEGAGLSETRSVIGARRWKFERFGQLAGLLGEAGAIASPLQAEAFSFEAAVIGLEEVSVLVARHSPLLLQAIVPADTSCCFFPLAGSRMRLNGSDWRPGRLAVHGPGAVHLCANVAPVAWAAVVARANDIQLLFSHASAQIGAAGATATLSGDPVAYERALTLFRAVDEVTASEPSVFQVDETRRSLRAEIFDAILELAGGRPGATRARLVRRSRNSERIIRAIDEHLRATRSRVATGADLARDLAIPEPRLRTAVRAAFGISLPRYLLLRRALALHVAISGVADSKSRRAIATEYGFWNLGVLEREYQSLFQEPFLPTCNRPQSASPENS